MRQRDFMSFFKENVNCLSLSKQEKEIDKMFEWLSTIRQKLRQKLKDKYYYCSRCCEYFPKKGNLDPNFKTIVQTEVVHPDCGYGDDDILGDVTYHVYFSVCPHCGRKHEEIRQFIKVENEHRRY